MPESPLYVRIAENVTQQVASGALRPGIVCRRAGSSASNSTSAAPGRHTYQPAAGGHMLWVELPSKLNA